MGSGPGHRGLGLSQPGPFHGFSVEIGDLLILGSAVLWALQVVIVARYAPQMDSLLLAWVQIGTVAVAGMIFAGVTESPPIEWGASLILGLLYLAVLANGPVFSGTDLGTKIYFTH